MIKLNELIAVVVLYGVPSLSKRVWRVPLNVFWAKTNIQHVRRPLTVPQATSIAIYSIYFLQHAVIPPKPLVMIQGRDTLSVI
ncbi:hypothetical protein DWF74_02930 [Pseudomonas protegens]|nr:hypothetical protein DWF74_02930 [Pseudomonas protegens]